MPGTLLFRGELALVTGTLLLVAYASAAYENVYFRIKAAALVLAAVNALVYHTTVERRISEWDALTRPPLAARLAGLCSIILWTCVILMGRMTGYTLY